VLLGCFLFSGDDIDKKIKVLSGGEKARIALAKTIVSKANFLLLDEPTNHLDMHSCDLLIDALNKYEGSILLVSHDRYFISKTANKIWEIDDHMIREFKGTYNEWVDWKERNTAAKQQAATLPAVTVPSPSGGKSATQTGQTAQSGQAARSNQPAAPAAKPAPKPVQKPDNTPINKEAKKELQKQQRLFQELEQRIATLSRQKDGLEASLADPATYSDKDKFVIAEAEYKKASEELGKANRQYEQIFEKIMELEKSI
jgi:ATP-binding cassette subfamily F protein 3